MLQQYKPVYGEQEAQALYDLVVSGSYLADFKKTEEFENKIAQITQNKYCHAVNNGTIAISLALMACGVRRDDLVIVPNITMIATANAVKFIGAVPIFVDIEADTLCLDVEKTIQEIENQSAQAIGTRVSAVIYVTLNGRMNTSGIKRLKEYCKQNRIALLKDDAQSLGSSSSEGLSMQNPVYSDITTLSFSPHKLISCGQGGAILTNDEELSKNIARLKDFGRLEGGADIHDYFGINSKYTEMQAVVGIEQLKKFDEKVLFKRRIYELYKNLLKDCKGISMINRDIFETPWFIDIYFKEQQSWEMCNPRNKIADYLKSNGVGTRPIYPKLNSQKCYNEAGEFPVSDKIANTGLWLPSSFDLKDSDIEYICNKLKEICN